MEPVWNGNPCGTLLVELEKSRKPLGPKSDTPSYAGLRPPHAPRAPAAPHRRGYRSHIKVVSSSRSFRLYFRLSEDFCGGPWPRKSSQTPAFQNSFDSVRCSNSGIPGSLDLSTGVRLESQSQKPSKTSKTPQPQNPKP